MIRTRALTRDEVVSINFLLKSRSRQYLAAYDETWLFPEGTGPIPWAEIGKVLLPPSAKLWGFGGEIYIGYKDGSTQYQDAFGRTDTSYKYLKKKTRRLHLLGTIRVAVAVDESTRSAVEASRPRIVRHGMSTASVTVTESSAMQSSTFSD